jgi:hypothetical protein
MERRESVMGHPFLCPQCGSPTFGSLETSFCEDCVGDREIDEAPLSGGDLPETPPLEAA